MHFLCPSPQPCRCDSYPSWPGPLPHKACPDTALLFPQRDVSSHHQTVPAPLLWPLLISAWYFRDLCALLTDISWLQDGPCLSVTCPHSICKYSSDKGVTQASFQASVQQFVLSPVGCRGPGAPIEPHWACPPPLVLITEAPGCDRLFCPLSTRTHTLFYPILVVESHSLTAFWGDGKIGTWSGLEQVTSLLLSLWASVVQGLLLPGRLYPEPSLFLSQLEGWLGPPCAPPEAGCVRPGRSFNLPVASFPHLLRGDNVFEGDLPPREAGRLIDLMPSCSL